MHLGERRILMGKKNIRNNNGSRYIPDKKVAAVQGGTMGSTSQKDIKVNESDKDNGKNETKDNKVGINKMGNKKNENVKNKMVYFNVSNKNEELILKWSSQGVTSFSSRVKQMLYEEMMNDEDFLRREGLRL